MTHQKLKLLDLFSGIGGFSLGLERTGGFETVAFCEIEEFPRKVLAKHWPEVPCYEDITTLEYSGPVDMVTAGFPCQDLSFAGKGAGLTGERSGLFWHVVRTVCMVGRPKLLLENVAALLSRGMGSVLGALASIGYDTEWDCIPAAAVGAPHLRDRVFVLAHAEEERCSETGQLRFGQSKERVSCSCEETVSANDRQERVQRLFPQEICRKSAFSWCKDVRGPEDLRGRPDLPTPLFRGSLDGIPNWVDRVGAPGNAVVPQIPELLGNAYLESISWRAAA